VSGHAGDDGLGLYVSLGTRIAFYPFTVCYSCGSAPEVVAGHGSEWMALGVVGFELPVYATFSLHVEVGAEVRFHFLDSSIPVFPVPVVDGGVTWHW
jgi:hypothetical protein